MFLPTNLLAVLQDLKLILITFFIAICAGVFLKWLSIPAPYLLGSLAGVWLLGAANKSVRSSVGVPRWFQVCVILGLGTMIGGSFRPNSLEQIMNWAPSVFAMFVATILATATGLVYLVRCRKYEFKLALLCCIPGGQAEMVLVSRNFVEKDYVVALFHLVRVTAVFCLVPLLLTLVQGGTTGEASATNLAFMPSVFNLSATKLFSFITISILSLPLAKFISLPMPYLLGPLIVSSTLHISGVVEIPRVSEFIVLAQLTIGGMIGARLASVEIFEIIRYIKDAIFSAFFVILVYVIAALIIGWVVEAEFLPMFLAFVPGGFYEVTLLALIFGFDVAYVAFHHTIRVMIVFLMLPVIMPRKDK